MSKNEAEIDILDEILEEASRINPKESRLAAWLRQNPDIEELYWRVMQDGYKVRGIPFNRCLISFLARFPDAPETPANPQHEKRRVDARLSDR